MGGSGEKNARNEAENQKIIFLGYFTMNMVVNPISISQKPQTSHFSVSGGEDWEV